MEFDRFGQTLHENGHGTPPELYRRARWYACRTRARAEKRVRDRLNGMDLEPYLPLIARERQWADRRKIVDFPIFPGYVFARFDLTRLGAVLKTPGLVTVVRLNGHPTPMADDEIEAVRRLADGASESGVLPTAWPRLEPGERVVVVDGPFRGMRGELIEDRGATRVVVRLTAIRQAVSVEMRRELLKAAGT